MRGTDREERLKSLLQDYWVYQIHYYMCYFDSPGFFDFFRDRYINDPRYAGRLCLKIATWFCKADETEWKKVLQRHGVNSEFYSRDMSFHLNLIMSALREVNPNYYSDPCMLNAINMARDPQYADQIRSRKREISPTEGPRSVLRV